MSFLCNFLKNDSSLPELGHVEIVLFGTGFGESILVHLPNGQWIVVDSCIDPQTRRPCALQYFEALGVDLSLKIEQIVITHWHDDHIRGMAEIVRCCPNAEVVISTALRNEEFMKLTQLQSGHRRVLKRVSTGVDEFIEIFALLLERKRRSHAKGNLRWAACDKLLYRHEPSGVSVFALSPSDDEILRAVSSFARLIPSENEPQLRMPRLQPNDTAIALWLQTSAFNILLGSDLEVGDSDRRGWRAIVDSTCKPLGKSIIFKVPHHGSISAHHERIWLEMLEKSPYAILTPFSPSQLPRPQDIKRICEYTERCLIASWNPEKSAKRESSVEKTLTQHVKRHRVLENKLGMIRLRGNLQSGAVRSQLFGAAKHLHDIISNEENVRIVPLKNIG